MHLLYSRLGCRDGKRHFVFKSNCDRNQGCRAENEVCIILCDKAENSALIKKSIKASSVSFLGEI